MRSLNSTKRDTAPCRPLFVYSLETLDFPTARVLSQDKHEGDNHSSGFGELDLAEKKPGMTDF